MDIISVGELIVEIMRREVDVPLGRPGVFLGPFPSGAPAIMIDAAARAGLKAGFVGAVGSDEFGDCILQRFTEDGVDMTHVRRIEGEATGCAFIAYEADGGRRFIFHMGTSASGRLRATTEVCEYARRFRHCHLMGCSLAVNEAMRETALEVAREVKNGGGTISFDPNVRPELCSAEESRQWLGTLIDMSDIVLPSAGEATLITSAPNENEACRSLHGRGVKITVLKLGASGCRVFGPEGEFDSPGFHVEVIDPTGAGDCFDAGFITGWLEGRDLEFCARLANAMGALGAATRGPMEGVHSRDEVEEFMRKAEVDKP